MKAATLVVVALVLMLNGVSTALAQTVLTFSGPTAVVLNFVQPSRTEDFERVMEAAVEAQRASTDQTKRAQAEGWSVLRASESGPNNLVIYCWILNPTVPGANYAIAQILVDGYPEDYVREIFQEYVNALEGGGEQTINLTPIGSVTRQSTAAPQQPLAGIEVSPQQSIAPSTPGGSFWATATTERYCADRWATDSRMRDHCQNQQREGLNELRARPMNSTDEQVIRAQCASQWPDDMRMRNNCENQLLEALGRLRNR